MKPGRDWLVASRRLYVSLLPLGANRHLNGTLARRVRLWRVVALFFLVLTFSELVLAGTCGPELLGFPSDIADHVTPDASSGVSDGGLTMSPGTNQAPHDHSGEGGCSSDDCFCCCGHINVPAPFIVPVCEPDSSTTDPIETLLQSGPPDSLFRPPRIL